MTLLCLRQNWALWIKQRQSIKYILERIFQISTPSFDIQHYIKRPQHPVKRCCTVISTACDMMIHTIQQPRPCQHRDCCWPGGYFCREICNHHDDVECSGHFNTEHPSVIISYYTSLRHDIRENRGSKSSEYVSFVMNNNQRFLQAGTVVIIMKRPQHNHFHIHPTIT